MEEASYYWERATKLRERAQAIHDQKLRKDLLEEAQVCEEMAANLEERAPGG